MSRSSIFVFSLLVTVLSLAMSSRRVDAGEKEEELQSLLGRYAMIFPEYNLGMSYDLYYSYEGVNLRKPDELPILVEATGTFASKMNRDYYYYHLERVVNRVNPQMSYEAGLRTPRGVRFGVNVNQPLKRVSIVPDDRARSRQFLGGVHDHDPWFVPVQQFLDLERYEPFVRDRLVPLKVIEDGIDKQGRRWFAYAPVHLPGAVYVITFDKSQKWLPVSYRHHYHQLLVEGKLNELMKDLSQLDETKYKEWKVETSVSTEWQAVGDVYLPRIIRSVQKTMFAEFQVVFQYRNWKVGDKAVADLFDVGKFEAQQFPGEDYFAGIREAFEMENRK